MANLGALRALAQRVERVVPYRLPTDEANQFRKFAQQKYSPMARKLSDREFDLRMKFPEYDDAEQARVKQLIEQLSHEAARYSMLDHAASSIAKARLYGDEDLRARLIRDSNGIPGGIATFYPPSHFPGDPLAHGATYVEHLGATGEPGQGRVLLRGVGLENPEDPLILQSLNYPETTGFYEARGGWRVPYENQQGSALRSLSLPVFKWDRGDAVKEKEGGSVKPQKFQVGGLARYFAKNAPKGLSAMSELGTYSSAPLGALSVVKQKGGNWLTGSVEGALEELKPTPPFQGYLEDYKLWEHAAPEGSIMSRWVRDDGMLLNDYDYSRLSSRPPITSWVDKQLTRYIKNEMATPEDPIRALAEQGILHFEPRGLRDRAPIMDNVFARRAMEQMPVEDMAKTPLGIQWERYADAAVSPRSVSELGAGTWGKNPWLKNLDKDDTVYAVDSSTLGGPMAQENLGFDHLIDELANALNPESGLPTRLQIDPKKLSKVSVPQMVQRVHDINQWRAAQKAEADALRANNAATSLVREYPENNPLGLRWVELKAPETTWKEGDQVPEGFSLSSGRRPNTFIAQHNGALESSGTHPSAEAAMNVILQKRVLSDALKYEGDTMGHCVGGYCDDVLSGRARIFSLRDAKGEPHVTVEVSPQPRNIGQQDIPDRYIDDAMEKLGIHTPEGQWGREEEIERLAGDLWRRDNPTSNRIVQIKGKQNRAPNAEYLPFVQDFIRNSPLGAPWSEVGDFENTGLFNLKKFDEAPHWSNNFPLSKDEWKQIATDIAPIEFLQRLRQSHPEDDYITSTEFRKALGLGELK